MQPFTLSRDTTGPAIGVLVTPSGDCRPQLMEIEAWARGLGVTVSELGTSAAPNGLASGCELVIALGGDGTILRALQLAMSDHAAVLDVNSGTVGFLADVDGEHLGVALESIARGDAKIDDRTALVATMHTPDDHNVIAFNDVVITRRPGFGTARLRSEGGGEPLLRLSGDGVVIASPTGSTAYT